MSTSSTTTNTATPTASPAVISGTTTLLLFLQVPQLSRLLLLLLLQLPQPYREHDSPTVVHAVSHMQHDLN